MASLLILVLCASLGTVLSGQIGIANLSQDIPPDPKLLALLMTTDPCTVNYSCLNCTTVRICALTENGRSLQETHRFTCPVGNWCDPLSGTCIAEQPKSCMIPADFTCMRDGYYPDLNDCSRYFYCHQGNSFVFKCAGSNRYYSPLTETCTTLNHCINKAICSNKNGVKVKVNNKQMFVYCSNGVVSAVDRCIGAYVFNEQKQVCEQACPHSGLFPKAGNCTSYYKCDPTFKTSTSYNMTELMCPEGEAFLESAYQCVNRTLVPNCKIQFPDMFN